MKKLKMVNNQFVNKLEKILEKNKNNTTQPKESFNDFLIIEKKR